MKHVFAWIVGIVVTLAVWAGLSAVGDMLNIASKIELGETITVIHGSGRGSYDEEIDSLITSYGSYSAALGLLVGCWGGMATFAHHWGAGLNRREVFSLLSWVMGTSVLLILSGVIDLAFKNFRGDVAHSMRWLLEGALLFGVSWAMYQWWKIRTGETDKR